MKSAYELAMERLNQQSPSVKLTAEQKKQIAALESRHAARVAEREIGLKSAMASAAAAGNFEEVEKLEQQWLTEKRKLLADLEEKKERVRQTT
jgi:hypothetical protein